MEGSFAADAVVHFHRRSEVVEVFWYWRPLSNLMTCSGSVAGMAVIIAANNARRRIEKRMVYMGVM